LRSGKGGRGNIHEYKKEVEERSQEEKARGANHISKPCIQKDAIQSIKG